VLLAWVEMRRLDHPDLPLAENPIPGFPNRLRYLGNEQQLKNANYSKASVFYLITKIPSIILFLKIAKSVLLMRKFT